MESRKAFIIRLFLFLLGFIAMSVQIVFIRQALAIFYGNELVIGLCLGSWMLLTAAGAYIGSFFKKASLKRPGFGYELVFLFLILIILPFFMSWELAFLRSHLLPAGVMAGINQIGIILFLSLAPFCLISGTLFPLLSSRISTLKGKNLIHQAYALDSSGSILAGIIFSLVLFMLPQVTSLKLKATSHRPQSPIFNLQPSIDKMLFPGQEVIEIRQTPFGKLIVTKLAEQYNLYANGNPISLYGDAAQREESVHYAMLLHPKPQKVLMISGGVGGSINEALKYPGVQVDYLDNNPWMISLVDKYVPFVKDPRLRIITRDPRMYVNKNDNRYDVILINTPDPSSAELNRFYTVEFLKLLKKMLNPGGIVSLSIPAAGNYMNESSRTLHSVIYATISQVFNNIRIIPGNRDYFLASDSNLAHSLLENLQKDGIRNLYVNPGYVNEDLMNARSSLIMKDILPSAGINSDLRPFIYLQLYRQWMDQFKIDYRLIPATLLIMVVLAFIFLRPINLGLFAGGFSSSSLEFILMIWFQAMYGVIYQVTGLIFAAFMAGMAAGSFLTPKIFTSFRKKEFLKMQSAFIILPLVLAPAMLLMPYSAASWLKFAIIIILVMITGLLMGVLFAISGPLQKTSVIRSAGQSFSADLLGSAIGILLTSVFLVPLFGLATTALLISLLNVSALIKVKSSLS